MLLIVKKKFVHVGIEADDTIEKLPHGIYNAEFNPRQQTTTFEDVMGKMSPYFDLERDIQNNIVDEVEHFFAQDDQRGILVHGGPGNGKTRMILNIMDKVCKKYNAIGLLGPDLSWITEIIKAVRADDPDRPIIIFWDEFDEIHENNEYELLRFLDGGSSLPKVLSIAALNDLEDLEPRLYKRPGRFGLVCELENPSEDTRRTFISAMLKNSDEVDKIVMATEGLSLDYVREITLRFRDRGQDLERIFKNLALDYPTSDESLA